VLAVGWVGQRVHSKPKGKWAWRSSFTFALRLARDAMSVVIIAENTAINRIEYCSANGDSKLSEKSVWTDQSDVIGIGHRLILIKV
jgi:hypothetical protein